MTVAILPVVLTALLPLAAFFTPPTAPAPAAPAADFALAASADREAPTLAAQALADAERVVAVHAIPGAVVFDLDRAGQLFQLTISLDDDGAVVATALDRRGLAATGGGAAAVVLDRIERIDSDGATVVLRDRAATATFAIAAGG